MSRRSAIHAAKKCANDAFNGSYDRRSAVRVLTKAGWKIIGRGCFATVLKNPDHIDVVIKVSARISNRRFARDRLFDGFADYARWIVKDEVRSKFAPRIYHFLPANRDRYCITVMEELQKPKSNREFIKKATATGANLKYSWRLAPEPLAFKSGPVLSFLQTISMFGSLDIHAANIMQRSDGSMVFTDPLISYAKGY